MGSRMAEPHGYDVLLTPEAEGSYLAIQSQADLAKVDSMLDVLGTVPGIGRAYDPLYEAARPGIDGLLVVYAGHYGIYYVVDEDTSRVIVLSIEDQRRDPMARFGHLKAR